MLEGSRVDEGRWSSNMINKLAVLVPDTHFAHFLYTVHATADGLEVCADLFLYVLFKVF